MAKDKVKTRPAESRDLEAVAALFDAYRQFYEKPADLALARRYITERFERRESVIIIAENAAGDIVGFTQLYPAFCSVLADRTFVLYDLFVTPSARGTGAGRALMEAAEAHARETGAARLQLETAKTNRIGQSLYESCGWLRDNDFYVYAKALKSS
jgi:ribosomal protein S18 acetylase RimI-like enzyme